VWAFETTYNQRLKMWHPHFHIIYDGAFMDDDIVRDIWFDITGSAFIIDVRDIRPKGAKGDPTAQEKKDALLETVKYICKSVEFSDDPKLIEQFLDSTRGMRQIGRFGTAYHYKPPRSIDLEKGFFTLVDDRAQGAKLKCGWCGYQAFPEFWTRLPGLFSPWESEKVLKACGDPPPPRKLDSLERALLGMDAEKRPF
jgi:hypothetical protein